MKNKIICKCVNGKLPAYAQLKLDLILGLFDDKDIEITVKKRKSKRSLSQNALYWVWMTMLGESIGHKKDSMHDVFKRLFLRDKLSPLAVVEFVEYLKAQEKDIEASTRKLTKAEMTEYLNKVDEQARNVGVTLPHPEDAGFWEFYEAYFE